jgi:uncharacterized protein YukE
MSEQRMDYDQAEEMSRELDMAAEKLQEMIANMQGVAERLEGGALLGRGGDAMVLALRSRFCPAIERLSEKLKEQAEYVRTEMYDMMEAERRISGLFRD